MGAILNEGARSFTREKRTYPKSDPPKPVISTEATDSLTVRREVERPLYLLVLPPSQNVSS